MGFLDKMKETAASVAEKATAAAESAKAEIEAKKAEKAAHETEMNEKKAAKAQEIISAIKSYDNSGSVFDGIEASQLLSFTKDFYDRLMLPAMSVALTNVSMYPYIDGKVLEKAKSSISEYIDSDTPIILIKAENSQFVLITDKSLYFAIALEEDKKYLATGRVDISEIDKFEFVSNDSTAEVICDAFTLASFKAGKVISEDFLSLTKYFDCLAKKDFEITAEEVDALVKEKIGAKVADEVKKYMVFDDEQFVYFAWGLDSLAAKDYIICTNKQIIVVDREAFGATSNIKQFYYEDITSASTEQNSNSSDLTGYLIDTAITAATKTCDLYFSVAGARTKIKTLYKTEAERIVALFHQFRKEAKTAAAQPQVIIQQAAPAADDPLEQLKKLNSLKEAGIITQEEFDAKKKQLLGL